MLPPGVTPVHWEGGQEPYDHRNHRALLAGLRKVIKEVKPDLIHAGPVQTAAWLAAQTRFHPLVTMSWGSDLLVDAGSSPQLRRLTDFTLQRTDVLIGDCQAVRDKAVSLDFPADRIVTFPWGVDLEEFSPRQQASELRARRSWQEDFVVLHLRSWEPVYGVDVFAKAFLQAARQRPQMRLFLLANGSLAPQIHKTLMPLVDRVQFAGQISYQNLPDYYHAADLYVSASHSDGSSVSLMEALASGLPALLSDIPGNREWIAGSNAGWLFPDGDVDALAQALVETVDARQSLSEVGKNARALAESRADWSKNAEKLIQAYHLAINMGGKR
jgi:glycosyltransferase involved in cell wall biosynthesis